MLKLGLIFAIIQPNISSPVLTKIAKVHVIWFADSCASSFRILGQRRSCFFLLFSSFDHYLNHALLAVMLCLLWITKRLWLEGTSGHHPCQAPCTKQGHLEQVAQGSYPLGFWIFPSMVTRYIFTTLYSIRILNENPDSFLFYIIFRMFSFSNAYPMNICCIPVFPFYWHSWKTFCCLF